MDTFFYRVQDKNNISRVDFFIQFRINFIRIFESIIFSSKNLSVAQLHFRIISSVYSVRNVLLFLYVGTTLRCSGNIALERNVAAFALFASKVIFAHRYNRSMYTYVYILCKLFIDNKTCVYYYLRNSECGRFHLHYPF